MKTTVRTIESENYVYKYYQYISNNRETMLNNIIDFIFVKREKWNYFLYNRPCDSYSPKILNES